MIETSVFDLVKQEIDSFLSGLVTLIPRLIFALLFLLLIWILLRFFLYFFKYFSTRFSMRSELARALQKLISVVVWSIAGLITITLLVPSLTVPHLFAGLGVGSIVMGLAFRDILGNFFSGMFIMFRDPMRKDDFIECGGISGQVKNITLLDIYLRRDDGVLIMVPSSFIYKNPCHVITYEADRLVSLLVSIAIGEDLGQAREVIVRTLKNIPSINQDKAIRVMATKLNSYSVELRVTWWADSDDYSAASSKDEVVVAIKAALEEAEIQLLAH